MKRISLAATVLVAAVGQAVVGQALVGKAWAADLPAPAPPPAQAPAAYVPAPSPVYNWGGVYFGINGGYGFGSSKWTTAAGATTGTFNTTGFLVGATLGANVQFDAFVMGLEGDFDGSWLEGTTNNLCTPVACETKQSWLSTLRGRIGYAADRVLFYGTGGGAFGNIEGNTFGTTFQSKSEPGWTAGAGIEAAFTENLTARVEYLFFDLQSASLPAIGSPITVKLDGSLIRLGVMYKFR